MAFALTALHLPTALYVLVACADRMSFYGPEQGLRNMLARLAPLAQQRKLLQGVSDLQADKIGNEVRKSPKSE